MFNWFQMMAALAGFSNRQTDWKQMTVKKRPSNSQIWIFKAAMEVFEFWRWWWNVDLGTWHLQESAANIWESLSNIIIMVYLGPIKIILNILPYGSALNKKWLIQILIKTLSSETWHLFPFLAFALMHQRLIRQWKLLKKC